MTGPQAGEPRERKREVPTAHRIRSWLVWWVLMMWFWVIIDDSVATDELLAGAGAAALAALFAEVVTYQAGDPVPDADPMAGPGAAPARPGRPRHGDGLRRAVAAAGPRRAAAQRVLDLPTRFGDDCGQDVTRRTLLIGGTSLAPNTFVLGIDADTDLMVVHRLVSDKGNHGREDMTW